MIFNKKEEWHFEYVEKDDNLLFTLQRLNYKLNIVKGQNGLDVSFKAAEKEAKKIKGLLSIHDNVILLGKLKDI